MADVFISHSSKDKMIADSLVKHLETKGLTCWIAPRDILPGTEWAAAINNAISETKIMIVIYSANSAPSTQVTKELNIADKKQKFIIPYMIDNTELSGTFEYFFTGAHWVMANPKKNDYKIDELYGVIAGVLKTSVQNVTNNTYIDNVTINNAPQAAAQPDTSSNTAFAQSNTASAQNNATYAQNNAASAQKKFDIKSPKGIAAISAAAVALAAVIIIPIAVTSSKNNDVPVSTNDTTVSTDAPVEAETTTASETEKTTTPKVTEAQTKPAAESISFELKLAGNTFQGTYTGDLKNGVPDGTGSFTGKNDSTELFEFTGKFKSGVVNGKSKFKSKKTSGEVIVFEGEFVDGVRHGQGVYTRTYTDDNEKIELIYSGEWVDDNLCGQGEKIITYRSGDISKEIWEGEFADSKLNGQGVNTVEYTNGDVKSWTGTYVNNSFNGYGTAQLNFANGNKETWEGEWTDGVLSGKIIRIAVTDRGVHTYEGDYIDHKRTGYGKETFERTDGYLDIYEGEWVDGMCTGEGVLIHKYTDGKTDTVVGSFSDNLPHGYAEQTIVYPNGDSYVYKGNWYYGAKTGKAKEIFTNSGQVSVREGEWNNGNYLG